MGEITLIGDVHGKYDSYCKIVRQKERHPFTVQLGDFGFKYSTLNNLDPSCHKILGGNHDNYDVVQNCPHYLGDFGLYELNGVSFFYYRGAYSIDRQYRTIGIDWWDKEQLRIEDFQKAREVYRQAKPDVVLTHDCPQEVAMQILPPGSQLYENLTGWALNELFSIHQPKIWRFGHYHRSWKMNINGTEFKCLDELEVEKI